MKTDMELLMDIFIEELSKNFPSEEYAYQNGSKFYRVVNGNDVYAFVEKETGDCYYPASWKAPAPGGPRANISTPEGLVDALDQCCPNIAFASI